MDVNCNSNNINSSPWSVSFIFSLAFVFLSGPFFYILYAPFLSIFSLRVLCYLILSLLWSLLIILGLVLILSDPSDKRISLKTNASLDSKYCLVCKANVYLYFYNLI